RCKAGLSSISHSYTKSTNEHEEQRRIIVMQGKSRLWERTRRGFWFGLVLGLYLWGFHGPSVQAQEFLFKIPQQPSFSNPFGVAIDPEGFLWVADTRRHQVVKFDPGKPGVETRIGSIGFGDGQFYYPLGVAGDAAGAVYVADTENHRLQVF